MRVISSRRGHSIASHSHRMIFVRTWLPGYESTAPVADIIGPQEQRVPSGSTITLRCVILSPYQTRPIRGVQWLRDNKLLTFQVMQPQLDTRGRTNEISVWRPGIGRGGGVKKERSYIINGRREGMWVIWPPSSCLPHFCLRSSLRRLFLSARYDDGWKGWSIWQSTRFCRDYLDMCLTRQLLETSSWDRFSLPYIFLLVMYCFLLRKFSQT